MALPLKILVIPRLSIPCTSTLRYLSTSSSHLSKASKSRIGQKKSIPLAPRPSTSTSPTPIKQALRGTGVGASERLYPKEQAVVGRPSVGAESKIVSEERDVGREEQVKAAAREAQSVRKNVEPNTGGLPLRGTGVGADERLYPKGDRVVGRDGEGVPNVIADAPFAPMSLPSIDERMRQENRNRFPNHEELEETIYTANPPFKVALLLTGAFVFAVFSLNAADTVRVGLSSYNEETGEHELASRWKRWTLGSFFVGISIATVSWACLAPARIVTRLTLRRPLNSTSTARYPPNSLISIHTPITKFPMLSTRTVPMSTIHLLGPISQTPQPWHPKEYVAPPKPLRKGPIADFLRTIKKNLIADIPDKKPRTPWGDRRTSHSPIIIKGDRASYSLAVRRGKTGLMDDENGAWFQDTEELEKSLLGVAEDETYLKK